MRKKSLFGGPPPIFETEDNNEIIVEADSVLEAELGEEISEEPQRAAELKKLNCLQIGIHAYAEYAYLVGYPDVARDRLIWKPSDLPEDATWDYYGVDGDPICILDWCDKKIPNSHWINVFLWNGTGIIRANEIKDALPTSQNRFDPNFFVGSITLSQLIRSLDIDDLEILAMDIEGCEMEVFHEYDWSLRPRYLIVETHSDDIKISLANLFISHGYIEVDQILTNSGMTTELIYLRGD